MKRTAFIIIATASAFAGGGAAFAQSSHCRNVETIGNGASTFILEQVNGQVAGTRERISRRKTLVIHDADQASFKGCTMTLNLNATLKRKVRRDARGDIKLKANVASFDRNRICLSNVRVSNVSLSRTLNIGEAIYRRVANKSISNNQCFSYSL